MYSKIPHLRTPPDPDSARIRILFHHYFICSIISGAGMISIAYLYTVHNYTYTIDTLLGPRKRLFTYICIILCIFLGPQKKLTQKP